MIEREREINLAKENTNSLSLCSLSHNKFFIYVCVFLCLLRVTIADILDTVNTTSQ